MACAVAASVSLAVPASGAFAGEQQPFLSSTGMLPKMGIAACHACSHPAKYHAEPDDHLLLQNMRHQAIDDLARPVTHSLLFLIVSLAASIQCNALADEHMT